MRVVEDESQPIELHQARIGSCGRDFFRYSLHNALSTHNRVLKRLFWFTSREKNQQLIVDNLDSKFFQFAWLGANETAVLILLIVSCEASQKFSNIILDLRLHLINFASLLFDLLIDDRKRSTIPFLGWLFLLLTLVFRLFDLKRLFGILHLLLILFIQLRLDFLVWPILNFIGDLSDHWADCV